LFHWLIFFNFSYSYGISVSPRFFEWVLVSTFQFKYIKLSHNGLRVGDAALCCACGKAILLTRCYGLVICNHFLINRRNVSSLYLFSD
jgi:hypothetical protein